jgi:hypothetical protein
MASYLGAFPFAEDAPAVLGFEQMIKVIVIMTERYGKVLKRGNKDRARLLYRSLAVYDRFHNHSSERELTARTDADTSKMSERTEGDKNDVRESKSPSQYEGYAIDKAVEMEDDEDDEDTLDFAALESLDAIEVFKHGEGHSAKITFALIPPDNFRKLIMFLLLIAPLGPQEKLSTCANNGRLEGERLEGLRRTADSVLAAFVNVEKKSGVGYQDYRTVMLSSTVSVP